MRVSKETKSERIARKQKEFRYAIYRTICNGLSVIFTASSFVISLLIFWKVWR